MAIVSGAVCLFLTAIATRVLSSVEAFGLSLIVWTYPGYQMWAGKGNAVYVFSFGMFCVGLWLFTCAFGARGGRHLIFRVMAALIFFFSFALNSIMVLYAFAMLGLFVTVWRGNARIQGAWRRLLWSAWECVTRFPDFGLLPLIYWGVLNIWFKRNGVYATHYNTHVPGLAELLAGLRTFWFVGYQQVFKAAILDVFKEPLLLGLLLLPTAAVLVLARSEEGRSRVSIIRILLPLLLSGFVFVGLSIPYLIAGLEPAENFYESRHLLLFGIPLALFLLGLKRLIESASGERVAFIGVIGLAFVLSVIVLWNDYLFMQGRALKQAALSIHLAGMPKPPATVFNLEDGFLDRISRPSAFGLPEVTGMLRLAWGDHPFLGFSLSIERSTILQEMELSRTSEGSAYRHIDPSGPQATISLQPGPVDISDFALTRRYYACRLLARCDVSDLLTQLASVTIRLGPIPGIIPLEPAK